MRGLRTAGPGVLVLAALAAAGCSRSRSESRVPPPREIEVLTLAPSEIRDTGEYLGTLLSRASVNVVPQVAGYVHRIHVRPGQRVQAGAPLVEIDSRKEAAAVQSARAQQESARARLLQANQARERAEALYKEGLVSAAELEQARADARAAEAAANSALAELSQREVQLQYHVVRAAVPGVVGDVLVRIGDFVSASTQLTSIAQADVLELSVLVPADRARALKLGAPIELLDREGAVMLQTEVFFVAPQADPVTQLVEVKAVFQNSVGLRPNEWVRARVVYATRSGLSIPTLAVVRQSGQPFAFVVVERDGSQVVERRPLVLGALGENAYVLEDGLKEGDRIAVSSLQMLKDGAPVKVKPLSADVSPPQRKEQSPL